MRTAFRHSIRSTLIFFIAILTLCACERRCQQLPEQPFQSVSDTEWRLVRSTARGDEGLDAFNFYILKLDQAMTIEIYYVRNNRRDPEPTYYGSYYVPSEGVIIAELQTAQSSGAQSVQYQFDLSNRLYLYAGGATMEFYPFEGIVKPDNLCTF